MNIDTLRRLFPTGEFGAQNKNFAVRTATNSTEVATTTDGVTWTLTSAGTTAAAANEVDADAVAATAQGVGSSPVGTSVATESSLGVQRTVLTLTDVAQSVPATTNGQYVGTKIYTFPAGRILVLGVTATVAQKTTSDLASTLNASKTGALAIGTATASNQTLDSAMANLLPSTAFTSSATVNVAGTAVSSALASSAQFDGTATAVPVYINTSYATDLDVDATATQTLTGTVVITWLNLGDY